MNHPTLRLTQYSLDNDRFVIKTQLDVPHEATQTVDAEFTFALTAQDREDMRWYLENYLQYPLEPNPTIAHRIEDRLKEVGLELFHRLFEGNTAAIRLWGRLVGHLPQTRVEIVTEVAAATAIPWELLRDPETDRPLAITAHTFVRSYSQAAQRPILPRLETGDKIRVLLVIARPQAGNDVPFRSVAIPLLKGFGQDARQYIQLDVLRPPTYPTLADTLRQAHTNGQPYHVVHFDGHGTYDTPERIKRMGFGEIVTPLMYGDPNQPHGFLLFENPDHDSNAELVDGVKLGQLLADCGVPVLILNACKSAYAETELGSGPPEVGQHPEMVRQFGSLAQIIMNAGVAGVVAMAYNVYVVTAAQFVAKLYEALRQGQPLGTAVSQGRKNLYDNPQRAIAFDPLPLQDWSVPIVYEAASLNLFTPQATATLAWQPGQLLADGFLDEQLPGLPEVGEFIGRHETLLALDRAFDSQQIVLLYGGAGSGKTTASAEFARWYSLTGGLGRQPVVLFSSLERYLTLPRLLDKVRQVFGGLLEQNNIQWLALDDSQRRTVTLQLFQQLPVLWLWDNVEPVAGFPAGADTPWSQVEQQELVAFLRACASQTRARFLLTSRRDEQGWLGGLPRRIPMPPMPFAEGVELARALAEKQGYRLTEVEDWTPLLRYCQGNPLTLTVIVGQALREKRTSRADILAFVRQLRAGEAKLADDEQQGRDKSLGASLSYGFSHAFNETERRILALLHLFQGFVDVDALVLMGDSDDEWSLPDLHGLSRDQVITLLDRAAEIGLLTALGGGFYRIHPALPWYFHDLFQQQYAASREPLAAGDSSLPTASGQRLTATYAYTQAIATLGNYYFEQYADGNRDVIALLTAEEANLLQARTLARWHSWPGAVIMTMQGLQTLYGHTGRRGEWARLVQEIVPEFVDPATDGPKPGLENEWSLVTQHRVTLAQEQRQWTEAERLQQIMINWDREQSAAVLALTPEQLTPSQRNQIRSLGVSLHQLGQIQREQSKVECVVAYKETFELDNRIADNAAAAIAAFSLGHAYKDLPTLRDLDQAESWYRRSLELRPTGDRQGQGRCYGQLGAIAYERFQDARRARADETETAQLTHLNAALSAYHHALNLLPTNAINDLAVTHNQLGVIYKDAGNLLRALPHYQESIRLKEQAGNIYSAGTTRYNVALALAQVGRLGDALLYAQAALRNFQPYGAGAQADIDKTQYLISLIQRDMAAGG